MQTELTRLLGIQAPIIQGGMAWVAEHTLAAAVSNAGGLGIIGAANAPAEWVREQIRLTKQLTDKPFWRQCHADESVCARDCTGSCRGGRKCCYDRCRKSRELYGTLEIKGH